MKRIFLFKSFVFALLTLLSTDILWAQKSGKKETTVPATQVSNPTVTSPTSSTSDFDYKNPGRAKGNYSIKVKIKGLQNVPLYLADNFGDKNYMRDTCILDDNGVGVFTGNPKLQRGLYLIVFPSMASYYELPITDDQDFYFEADTSMDESKVKVTGSEENEVFAQFQGKMYSYGRERYKLDQEFKKAKELNNTALSTFIKAQMDSMDKLNFKVRENYIAQYPNHLLTKIFKAFQPIKFPENVKLDSMQEYYFYKSHYWDNIDFTEDGLIRAPKGLLVNKLNDFIDRVVFQDPDSLVSAVDEVLGKTIIHTETQKYFVQYLTTKFQDRKIMCQDNVTVHMINTIYCQGKAWWYDDTANLRKMCDEAKKATPTMCGKIAPNLKMEDTSGRFHILYEKLGKVTIVFFYDPTCGHCKEVIPVVSKVHKKLKNKGVVVYAISTEGKYAEWKKLMQTNPDLSQWINVCKTDRYYPWPIYRQDYNITANPTLFVLDENAKIIGKKIDEHQLEFFVESILYEKGLIDYKPTVPKEKPAKPSTTEAN